MLALVNVDREQIAELGRVSTSVLAVHEALQRQPVATAGALAGATKLTPATINKALAHLQKLGIVGRLNERRRGRVFSYQRYVELLNAELAPIA